MPIRVYHAPSVVLAALCAFGPTVAAARADGGPEPIDAQIIAIVADPRIDQASGIATSPDGRIMYAHQDAGRSDDVFALDSKGKVRFTIRLPAGSNDDWEDMAAVSLRKGTRAIFIGDIGDAFRARKAAHKAGRRNFRLFRFGEPPTGTTGQVPATGLKTYRLRYADGIPGRNSETLLVQPGTGHVFVVNKTESDQQVTSLWAAPAHLDSKGVNALRKAVPRLPITRASGGGFSPTGDRLVIRNDDTAYVWWINDGDVAGSLAEKPTEISLPQQRQGEGVTFTPDGHALLVNSEGKDQPIWRIPLPSSVDRARPTAASRPPERAGTDGRRTTMIAAVTCGVATLIAIGLIGFHLRRRA